MKKIISILLLGLAIMIAAPAESTAQQAAKGYMGALDTLTDAESVTQTLTPTSGYKGHIQFVVNITKISGTVAGTIKYYGTINGTVYELIETDNLTDSSGVFGCSVVPSKYVGYKIVYAGSGTMGASFRAEYLYR